MSSVFARGKRLWARIKGLKKLGKWDSEPTPYNVGEEDKAEAYAIARQKRVDRKNAGEAAGFRTINDYVEKWLAAREKQELVSFKDDKARLYNHALPIIGDVLLSEFNLIHVRDMVRDLERNPKLSPRTVLHIYGIVATMLRDAQRESFIQGTPWDIGRFAKPERVDKDPEWRDDATYELEEVLALISSPCLPPIRRVQYALKALAGLRHGEIAGLRVRNYDRTAEPLGKLVVARSYNRRRTKTKVTRPVPVHPLLARILNTWLRDHWPARYGREPGPDDLIVATEASRLITANYAAQVFTEDLETLGLRVKAGAFRSRGGHDLRAWFSTTAKDCGANSHDVDRITHTKKKDVIAGYTRTKWPALCAAVLKLPMGFDGDPLATSLATLVPSDYNDEGKEATPTGFEPVNLAEFDRDRTRNRLESGRLVTDHDRARAALVASLATAGGSRQIGRVRSRGTRKKGRRKGGLRRTTRGRSRR